LLEGGESGPAVVPGDLEESLLISALKHNDFEMPPKGKLPSAVIADFEKWIKGGAIDPRRATNQVTKPKSIDIEAGRKHWAYHPLQAPALPEVKNTAWPSNDIDRFILARLAKNAKRPAADLSTPGVNWSVVSFRRKETSSPNLIRFELFSVHRRWISGCATRCFGA